MELIETAAVRLGRRNIVFGLIKIINNGRCIRYRVSFLSRLICEKYLEYGMVLEIM